jgi:hypothetical protein
LFLQAPPQQTFDNGTYETAAYFRSDASGEWVRKPVNRHTMYPNDWSREEVVSAVQETYEDVYVNQIGPALQRGESVAHSAGWAGDHDGVTIKFYVDRQGAVRTAFPFNQA